MGTANVFISHAYDYLFLDVFDAMKEWERSRAGGASTTFYYYFDLFAVNQHTQSGIVPFEVLRDEFGGSVSAIGHTLLVLKWTNPIPLTRAWCVFEIATSLIQNVAFEVVMPPTDAALLQQTFVDAFPDIAATCSRVDVERAEAREAADLENILFVVRGIDGGASRTNALVVSALKTWIINVGKSVIANEQGQEWTEWRHACINNFAQFCSDAGNFEQAEVAHRFALALCESREANGYGFSVDAAYCALRSARNLLRVIRQRGGDTRVDVLRRDVQALGYAYCQRLGLDYSLSHVPPIREIAMHLEDAALLHELLAVQRRAPIYNAADHEQQLVLTLRVLAQILFEQARQAAASSEESISFSFSDARTAEALLREAVSLGRHIDDVVSLGELLLACGDPKSALPLLKERLDFYKRSATDDGDDYRAICLSRAAAALGHAYKVLGDAVAAAEAYGSIQSDTSTYF